MAITGNDLTLSDSSKTQAQKLIFFEEQILNEYIASDKNKHIFGVMAQDASNSIYYSDNYTYGTDAITEEQQIVIIANLYWQDLNI